MKRIVFLTLLAIGWNSNAQITMIPDPGFEWVLISLGIDSDGEINGQVYTSDIENITELYIHKYPNVITDITGIEDFTALEILEI